MKLEEVAAELRPRVPWEAADLGCAMVRRHYPRVLLLWALTVLPVWALILFLCRDNLLWACFWIWIFQPLYGRAPLFHISRALFGDSPKVGEVLRATPGLWMRNIVYSLTLSRLTFGRSFLLPVILLEKPRWLAFRERAKVLKIQGDGAALTLITCGFLQFAFLLALFALARMLTANGVSPDWRQVFGDMWVVVGEAIESGRLNDGSLWWFALIYMCSITFIEPFYIGAGFGQYLDARTHLEGWDIELGFKRIGARLAKLRDAAWTSAKASLIVGALLFFAPAGDALAQSGRPTSEQLIEEILAHEDFEIHTRTEKVWRSADEGEYSHRGGGDMSAAQAVGDLLFWVVAIAAVAGLAWLIYANRHIFVGQRLATTDQTAPKARTVLGLDVAEESLPDDVAGAAWGAFRSGDVARAMKLLYRGSLSWLVERERLPVRESDTEADCVAHAGAMSDPGRVRYFGEMTEVWKAFSYGRMSPEENTMRGLCEGWPFVGGKGGGA